MKHTRPLLAATLALLTALQGCASAQRNGVRSGALPADTAVTGATIADLERDLDENPPGGSDRRALRDDVARYLAARGVEAAQTGDFGAAIHRLHQALVHYTPQELSHGDLPDELAPLARAILEFASARGDEAHSLAAARVLKALHTPDPAAQTQWQRITEWGTRNRTEFQRPWVAEGELAEIYQEIASIIPAQDILEAAADHLVARRRAAVEGRQRLTGNHDGPRLNYDEARQLRAGLAVSSAELAMVFLRVGDLREAANRITALGNGSDSSELASVLGSIAQGEGGVDALWQLVAQLERVDRTAAAGVCRLGRQTFNRDSRFAQCLAAAAVHDGDLGLASAHLERATTLAGADQRTLRAAIETSHRALTSSLGSDDLSPGRRAYERTRELLQRWSAQYRGQLAPVTEADLEFFAADLELSAGNLREAREHLTRATQASAPSRDAFYLLAEIAWRHRDGAEATRSLRAGLELPLRASESDSLFRPQYTLRLAQVARVAGDQAEARRLFDEAASSLDALARATSEHELAEALVHRAVAADALGDSSRVRSSLQAALDAAPDARDIAARAITFSLSRGRWTDARDFYRSARASLTLDRNWQAYFALWGAIAARLGRLEDDGGARHALETLAAQSEVAPSWTGRLAQRYTGALDRARLTGYARTTGQRAEALFYDGMLRLAEGDAAGSDEDLHAVLATEVLRYWEYEMAWEMLDRQVRPTAVTATPAVTRASR